MAAIGQLRYRLRLFLRSEQGMALPTALFAMIASFALASAAVLSSIDVQQGSKRDHNSKEAIAAADAGASVALLRMNRFQNDLTETNPCVGPNGEPQTPTGGWCPPSPTETVNGATFYYQVSEYHKHSEVSVVAVGTSGTVSRRVDVGMISHEGEKVFANEGLIGQENIALEGTAVEIKTNIGTNGSITSNGHATICGDLRHGNGHTYPEGEPKCGGTVSEGEKDLPPIEVPENLATQNTNCRLVPNCTGPAPTSEVDTYTKKRTSTNPWTPGTVTASIGKISVGQNASLTLGGADYLVCGIFVDSGQLIMKSTSQVRIFVDTPEHCGLAPGATQVEMKGNANIESTGFTAEQGYAVPQIYVLGDSGVKLTGNATANKNELMLYAPYSEVELGGNATWIGLLAGKSMRLHGSPVIEKYMGPAPEKLTLTSLWERTHYVECTGGSTSTPDAYC
jgi:hypothetical protein